MHYRNLCAVIGLILIMFSFTMLPPMLVSFIYDENIHLAFFKSFNICYLVGFLLWFYNRSSTYIIRSYEGFFIVVLAWVILCAASALPFIFAIDNIAIVDALFEATSGLTTTGIEILSGLDFLPNAIRYYHQQLQFIGGMGVIVLAAAVLPMLGIGGMQLYKSEIGGPVKDSKMTPRIKETASLLWIIYGSITVACILCYKVLGMTWFDAVCEAFGTTSTGGFSIYDGSFAKHANISIDIAAMFFMILGSLSFATHFMLVKRREFLIHFKNFESKVFFVIIIISTIFVTMLLAANNYYSDTVQLVDNAAFTVISMLTTTGLVNTNFASWPSLLPVLLMIFGLIGGCSGSTTGGLKLVRVIFIYAEGVRSLRKLLHPKAVYSLHLGKDVVNADTADAIRGYLSIFIIVYITFVLVIMLSGLDFYTACSAVTACLSNVGASVAGVADSYAHIPQVTKEILILVMVAGRLEVMTLLILFMPSFWRQ
jgi:trk system potassium uptake protein